MIVWFVARFAWWLYDLPEVSLGGKRILAALSIIELVVVITIVAGFCIVELPDLLRRR